MWENNNKGFILNTTYTILIYITIRNRTRISSDSNWKLHPIELDLLKL